MVLRRHIRVAVLAGRRERGGSTRSCSTPRRLTNDRERGRARAAMLGQDAVDAAVVRFLRKVFVEPFVVVDHGQHRCLA